MPKYEIDYTTVHPRVSRALALLDNDRERDLEQNAIDVAAKFPVASITALLNSAGDENVRAKPSVQTDGDDATAANSDFVLLLTTSHLLSHHALPLERRNLKPLRLQLLRAKR